MIKLVAALCAGTVVSAGLLVAPAEARDHNDRRCGHAVELKPGTGADVSAIVGNAMPRKDCEHSYHFTRAHNDTMRYGRPHSSHAPGTGKYGNFRIIRTYYGNGYWEGGRWHASAGTYRDSQPPDYRRILCKEYTSTTPRPNRFSETHVACLDGNGIWRVVR